jgi:predicted ester cyclase
VTPAANKELVRRLHSEVVGGRQLDRLGEFFAADFKSHNLPAGLPPGIDGVRAFFAGFGDGLDDLSVTIDVSVAESDLVAVRTTTRGRHTGVLFGLPASGRELAVDGVDILRIEGGQIVEHWGLTNTTGLLEQAG